MLLRPLVGVFCLALCLGGCSEEQLAGEDAGSTKPVIVAVNNPLAYFAERLIGDKVKVLMLAPAYIDPAMWTPGVDDALQLQRAELVLLNGAGYEKWLDKVSVAGSKLVVTSAGAKGQWIELDDQVTHSHGPQGEHAHAGYAFTTWMDYSLARVQAEAVAAALQRRWPQYRTEIDARLKSLTSDLDTLDQEYLNLSARLAGRQLIYSHPVYPYFQRRYQLPGHSLHWEPGDMPDHAQWTELQHMLGNAPLFVWEDEPVEGIVARMAALGVPWVVINPAANRSDRDWLAVQRENVAGLVNQAGAIK